MYSHTFRTPFSIQRILLGILGIAFFSAFFGLFLFVGWEDIDIECSRAAAGEAPVCYITERHFLDLYVREKTATSVTGVEYKTSRSSKTTTSKVVLSTPDGDVPLSLGSSNMNEEAKHKVINEIQGFLDSPDTLSFSTTMDMKNIAGYIGLAGAAFILWAIWAGIMWLIFPAKVMIDGSTMRIRPLGGKLRIREIPLHQISSVSIATGQEAYRLIYPKLSKMGGPSSSAPPSIMFTLSDGEQVIIPNFQQIPEERLRDIAEEIRHRIQ